VGPDGSNGKRDSRGAKGRFVRSPQRVEANARRKVAPAHGPSSPRRNTAQARPLHGAQRRKSAVSSFPERPECEPTNGQVFWLPDRPTCRTFPFRNVATRFAISQNSGYVCGFRPRLQRRDRNGFSPFSLFSTPDAKSEATPTSAAIVTWER